MEIVHEGDSQGRPVAKQRPVKSNGKKIATHMYVRFTRRGCEIMRKIIIINNIPYDVHH